MYKSLCCLALFVGFSSVLSAQSILPEAYNVVWTKQSRNSSESMPCGGGDIGLNVWTEDNEVLFYISRSGTFDENNTMLKLGRVRLKLSPNPFEQGDFSQELKLSDGYIHITGKNDHLSAQIKIWIDVFRPVVYVELEGDKPFDVEAVYENWRYEDQLLEKNESYANSYKWAPPSGLAMRKDSIRFKEDRILFFHRNRPDSTIFDITVRQQGMDSVKHLLYDPLKNLTFGGVLTGENMKTGRTGSGTHQNTDFQSWSLQNKAPATSHHLQLYLHTAQTGTVREWESGLDKLTGEEIQKDQKTATVEWWNDFWERSFVVVEPGQADAASPDWQMGRNYQLFRYMLACNAYGSYPTKFNGGLFTYDPCFVDSNRCFSPDFRNWGGGTFTAQNQRLVYFPMLKSGDLDLMQPQFDFYLRLLGNAELRSRFYWGHEGACFTEQLENFGLPNASEYGWDRPEWYDKGMQYNAWLEYQWDSALEFCLMMLEQHYYAGKDVSECIPFIESCLTFFDEHYQYLARNRGRKSLDENGHLVLYPGTACETYKMAYNATSTITALKVVTEKLLDLPETYLNRGKREKWKAFLDRIPPISYRSFNGKTTIAPAKLWERMNNTEAPQLYPVYPYGIFGIGKPGLDTAINTYKYDTDLLQFRSHIGWKQDNIFAARLGLTDEAYALTQKKLMDSGRRFPAFWGPGFDWVPDHNWGGSGMIGLQEMLLQTAGDTIYLFPAWPVDKDVHFKLHAPGNTTVEAALTDGKVDIIAVEPKERRGDVVVGLGTFATKAPKH